MKRLYLIAVSRGTRFAMPAETVRTVVQSGAIVPVPLADPRIAGLATLRSRVVTVIDMGAAIAGEAADVGDDVSLIVAEVAGHDYGFAVDEVEDVVEQSGEEEPGRIAFAENWAAVSTGFVEIAGEAVIVIDPKRLVTTEFRAAA